MVRNTASKLALMALLGAAAAEDVIVSLIIPAFAPEYIAASVVSVGDDRTTFALGCQSEVPKTECGISDSVILVAGPSTLALTATLNYGSSDIPVTMTAECDIDSAANEATCTQHQVQATVSGSESTVLTDIDSFLAPLTITAGAEKLTDLPAAASSVPRETTTETSASASATTSQDTDSEDEASSTGADESASTAGGEAATTSDDGNAAFPRITQNAILAGAAAVVGGAMLL